MFNMLFEHFSVCQSPTGGLREAFKESLGGGVSTPSSPWVIPKTTSRVCYSISPYPRKTIGYCLEWIASHRGVSSRRPFFIVVGKGGFDWV